MEKWHLASCFSPSNSVDQNWKMEWENERDEAKREARERGTNNQTTGNVLLASESEWVVFSCQEFLRRGGRSKLQLKATTRWSAPSESKTREGHEKDATSFPPSLSLSLWVEWSQNDDHLLIPNDTITFWIKMKVRREGGKGGERSEEKTGVGLERMLRAIQSLPLTDSRKRGSKEQNEFPFSKILFCHSIPERETRDLHHATTSLLYFPSLRSSEYFTPLSLSCLISFLSSYPSSKVSHLHKLSMIHFPSLSLERYTYKSESLSLLESTCLWTLPNCDFINL